MGKEGERVSSRAVESDFKKFNKSRMPKSSHLCRTSGSRVINVKKNILMQDPNLKCRHFGILWHILAFYGILVKKVMREELR